ncbi:MAG: M20/M25/M40 family metallo-hydrolase [Candidatus Eisenbacteria bacterium]
MRNGVRSLALMALLSGACLFTGARQEGSPVPPMFPSGRPDPALLERLPKGARVDAYGNVWVTRGQGRPHVLVLTHRDVPGYVVSSITPQGYLRLQRLGTPATALYDQFQVGRRVLVYTRGGVLPAVIACPSTHFRRGADVPVPEATVDDLWVDVGAESDREAEAMGIALLDPVVPPRTPLDFGSMVGMVGEGGGVRAASSFLLRFFRETHAGPGTTTFAWVSGGTEGGRGSRRLLETLAPIDSAYVVEAYPDLSADSLARGLADMQHGIPIIHSEECPVSPGDSAHAPSRAWADRLANWGGRSWVRRVRNSPDARVFTSAGIPTLILAMPEAYPGSGAERVWPTKDANHLLSGKTFPRVPSRTDVEWGLWPETAPASPQAWSTESDAEPDPHQVAWRVLRPLLAAYGVSEHESAVAEAIREQLPPGARRAARLDERGNLVLALGPGAPARLFVAHQDEIGYRVISVGADQRAQVAKKGGFYDWLYEGERVRVGNGTTGVDGVIAPRPGYLTDARPVIARPLLDEARPPMGKESRFDVADLRVEVGPWASQHLRPGDDVTVFHEIARLGAHRVSARAIDDRYGCAALVMAAKELWPRRKQLPNTIWLVWSVEEEIGLKGAEWLADSLAHHGMLPKRVHAVDTFVSSDSPLEDSRYGDAKLGQGAVVRAVDTSHEAPIEAVRATLALARAEDIPLQYGVTSGGNDGVPFAERGSINVPLAWPLRYSHSAVEVADLRDLESLTRLVIALSKVPATDDPNRP